MINPISPTTALQSPTESTVTAPRPAPPPKPHTVEDRVTLSGDKDHDGDSS